MSNKLYIKAIELWEKISNVIAWIILAYIFACAGLNGILGINNFSTTVHFNAFGEFFIESAIISFMVVFTIGMLIIKIKDIFGDK